MVNFKILVLCHREFKKHCHIQNTYTSMSSGKKLFAMQLKNIKIDSIQELYKLTYKWKILDQGISCISEREIHMSNKIMSGLCFYSPDLYNLKRAIMPVANAEMGKFLYIASGAMDCSCLFWRQSDNSYKNKITLNVFLTQQHALFLGPIINVHPR